MWNKDPFDEPMDEIYNEPLLDAYNLEKTDPKDRWEQEELNELEKFLAQEQSAISQDQIEQLSQIEAFEKLQEEERQQRNYEELIQTEQWEHVAFLLQQLNEH